MLGKDICLTILKISQLGNFCLEKKMQQSKITNHSSCKFKKILLLSQADSFKLAYNDRNPVIFYIICLYMLYLGQPTRQWYLSHMLWVNCACMGIYLEFICSIVCYITFYMHDKLVLVNQCKSTNLSDANWYHMQKLISYAIRAIVTWAASFEELQLFFDYIYRLAGT